MNPSQKQINYLCFLIESRFPKFIKSRVVGKVDYGKADLYNKVRESGEKSDVSVLINDILNNSVPEDFKEKELTKLLCQ